MGRSGLSAKAKRKIKLLKERIERESRKKK